jgi:ribosome-associated toxin RatA of RatAB toxin-antitoxin module
LAAVVDQATQQMVVGASPARTWDVLTDFARYPVWAHDLKAATVVEHDSQGRGVLVAYRVGAMGRSINYKLRYDYSQAPHVLPWELVEGDIMRRLDGSYELRPVDGDPDKTDVVYQLVVDLVIPLPGFVKQRAEGRIMHTALRELRDHLER